MQAYNDTKNQMPSS